MEDKKQHRSDNNDPRQVLKEIDEIARNLLDSGQVLGSGGFSEIKETKLTTSSGPLNLVRGRIRSKKLREFDQARTNLIGQINEAKAQIQQLELPLPLQTNDSKLQTPLQSDPQSVDSNRGENLQETQKAIREKNEQLNAARQSLNQLTEDLKDFEVSFKLNEPLLMAQEKANEEDLEKANQLLAKNNVRSPFLDFNLARSGKDRVAIRADHGNLKDYLNKTQLSPEDSKNIIGQLVLGLEALHRHNIVHRDIKLDNILVFEDKSVDPPRITVKIADFDSILVANKDGTLPKDTNSFGTIGYIDPQLLTSDPLAAVGNDSNFQPDLISGYKYTGFNHFKADFYSLGQTILDIADCTNNNKKQITDLGRLLKNERFWSSQPDNIMAIKKNSYFGKNSKTFFDDLRDTHDTDSYIVESKEGKEVKGYLRAPHSLPGDVLHLLPSASLQHAYNNFQTIVNQYNFVLKADEYKRLSAEVTEEDKEKDKENSRGALLKRCEIFLQDSKEITFTSENSQYEPMLSKMIDSVTYLGNKLQSIPPQATTGNPVDDKHSISSRIANEATLNDFRPTTEGATMHELAATAVNLEAKLAQTSHEDLAEDPSFHAQDWTKNLAALAEKMREIEKLKTVCKRFSVEQLNDYLHGHKGEKRYMFFSRHQKHSYQIKVINAIIVSKEDNDTLLEQLQRENPDKFRAACAVIVKTLHQKHRYIKMADAKNEAKAQAAPTQEDVKRFELKESLDVWIREMGKSLDAPTRGSPDVNPLKNRQFLVDSVRYAEQLSNLLATKIPDMMSERTRIDPSGLEIMKEGTFLLRILTEIGDINAQKSQKPSGWQAASVQNQFQDQDQKLSDTASTPDTSFTGRQR